MTTTHMPAGAGPAAPENDKARGQAGFVKDQDGTGSAADSAQAGHVAQLAEALRRKRFATAQALAALLGIALQATDSDRGEVLIVASLHALTKTFDDMAEVEAWLDKIGAGRRA